MISHGSIAPLDSPVDFAVTDADHPNNAKAPRTWLFDYLFNYKRTDDFLPEDENTVTSLRKLGADGMKDPPIVKAPGISIPAIYTFFGQFVDHDITLEKGSAGSLADPKPFTLQKVQSLIVNSRSPDLDLDNVYGPSDESGELAPRAGDRMLVRQVPKSGLENAFYDLPRGADGSAIIGDQRDDENLVISQLHLAFLLAHNRLVDGGLSFEAAQKKLRQHYQWIVLDDFLERIAEPNIVKRVRYHGATFFPRQGPFFMPLEFSVAAYRFGHSEVRAGYNFFNLTHPDAISGELGLLFSNARQPLTANWVIHWPSFLSPEKGLNLPRPMDTSLTDLLLGLPPKQVSGDADKPERNLAVRNLLRGYILRLPTGQAVAKAMGLIPLTEDQILSVSRGEHDQPKIENQEKILVDSKFLTTRTPLWFYILAEAAYYNRGQHLGPVGSTIIAEVLIEVLRHSTNSILTDPDWHGPTLGDIPGKFDIEDLLKLAGVL